MPSNNTHSRVVPLLEYTHSAGKCQGFSDRKFFLRTTHNTQKDSTSVSHIEKIASLSSSMKKMNNTGNTQSPKTPQNIIIIPHAKAISNCNLFFVIGSLAIDNLNILSMCHNGIIPIAVMEPHANRKRLTMLQKLGH